MNLPTSRACAAVLLASATLLGACGGDTAIAPTAATVNTPDTAPPLDAAPSVTLTLAAKTFRFSWNDVAGETAYRLLEDADGSGAYAPIATLAPDSTAHDHEVFLPARLNARYILQACQASHCLDAAPIGVSGSLVPAIGFLKNNAPALRDAFGYSVAVSDDGLTLAVGAPEEDSGQGGVALDEPVAAGVVENSGAVYVFVREGQAWRQQAFIKAALPLPIAAFGKTLALSAKADTLAVGAPDVGGGSVHVFRRQGTAWSLWQRLDPPSANSSFGNALALSAPGQVLVVGDRLEDSQGGNSGAAYVFSHDGALWRQQAMLKALAPASGDLFGSSVAINGAGDTIAVGSPDDSSVSPWGGAVYVFTGAGASWGPPQRLTAPFATDELGLGIGVALSRDGSTLAAGAPRDRSPATGVDGDASASGTPNSGAVHVFARQGAGWLHQAYLKASNTDQDDNFGRAGLAISATGDTLVVAAPYERSTADGLNGEQANNGSSDVGAGYVFQRQGQVWRQQAYVKASNSGGSDTFGWGLALSADGRTLAVGAPGESSSGSGWNAVQNNDSERSGALYLY